MISEYFFFGVSLFLSLGWWLLWAFGFKERKCFPLALWIDYRISSITCDKMLNYCHFEKKMSLSSSTCIRYLTVLNVCIDIFEHLTLREKVDKMASFFASSFGWKWFYVCAEVRAIEPENGIDWIYLASHILLAILVTISCWRYA